MATYREVQDRINLDYLNRTDLGSETKRAIQRAIKHYERERFWFNQTATALAAGSASFSIAAIPSDFLCLNHVTIRDSSIDTLLSIRAYDRIQYQHTLATASGVPTEICEHNLQLVMNRMPASATTITLHYTHALSTLSADADSNEWTEAAENLIAHRAAADMLGNVLRVGDPLLVQMHMDLEGKALESLRMAHAQRKVAGDK
jgi:hypothetical protein